MADTGTDAATLAKTLAGLVEPLRASASDDLKWEQVGATAQKIANILRVRDGEVDVHSLLGTADLAKTLTQLTSLALGDSTTPPPSRVAPVLELFRVSANFCMDHDENRGRLLNDGMLKTILTVLNGYASKGSDMLKQQPLSLSDDELKTIRTAVGVILNATIGFDPVRDFILTNQAEVTLLKVAASVYPPGSWVSGEGSPDAWAIRSDIVNWAWRVIDEIKEEENNVFNTDILPALATPLACFTSPYPPLPTPLPFDQKTREKLVQTDFDFLEEACTLIEALSLDMEDFRLALARGLNFPDEQGGRACLAILLDFIDRGDYHPVWSASERNQHSKPFDVCKAAVVKAVVEVAGEPKSEDVLWDDSDAEKPGGEFVARMVEWVSRYVQEAGASTQTTPRDDLAICACLSLGNLSRREHHASVLLSPPHSLSRVVASEHLLGASADIRLKHAALGFLKNLVQSSSRTAHSALYKAGVILRICGSGVWDENADAMTDIVQLGAIGVVKHLCNGSVDCSLQLLQAIPDSQKSSGLKQILALVKRSDAVPIKSEGARVLVNVVKSLFSSSATSGYAVPISLDQAEGEKQKLRESGVKAVLTADAASALGKMVGRSGKYPVLINEGLVALSLMSTQPSGASLVLAAIYTPLSAEVIDPPPPAESSRSSDASSPVIATPTSQTLRPGQPSTPFDMILSVMKNTEFPLEIRINACSLFVQLSKNLSGDELVNVKEAALPVVTDIYEEYQDGEGGNDKTELFARVAKKLVDTWKSA
ncbi:hypothetical protein DL96DRAFT_1578425 [Flagelloscypha sp. PMI_526]|nr:hypothetical protein DL96DRAFT_1578425 [Flagelloscypha sp. PMI_526]